MNKRHLAKVSKMVPQLVHEEPEYDYNWPGLDVLNGFDVRQAAIIQGRAVAQSGLQHDLAIALPDGYMVNAGEVPIYDTDEHRIRPTSSNVRGYTVWLYNSQGIARECNIGRNYFCVDFHNPVHHDGHLQLRSSQEAIGKWVIPEGLYPACPHCTYYHPESSTNFNACPVRPQVMSTECVVCKPKHTIYDTAGLDGRRRKNYGSNARARLAGLLIAHIQAFHYKEATMLDFIMSAPRYVYTNHGLEWTTLTK